MKTFTFRQDELTARCCRRAGWRALCLWCCALAALASPARAALVPGAEVVYDEDRNITWIREADSGQGQMTFAQAQAFADGYDQLGGTNWRLPGTPFTPDPSCTASFNQGDNCTASELGHMFYVELGNSAGSPAQGAGLQNRGPFVDLDGVIYWSGAQLGNGDVIVFNYFNGLQTTQVPDATAWVWLVHDGKLPGVPRYFWIWHPLTGWIIVVLIVVAIPASYYFYWRRRNRTPYGG